MTAARAPTPRAPSSRSSLGNRRLFADAFTIVELLAVIAILALLVTLVLTVAPDFKVRGQQAASLNNLRQISIATYQYAIDNDGRLPRRVRGNSEDRWPSLLIEYLEDPAVYAEPGNPYSHLRTGEDPLSNRRNRTCYIMNGYNDIGALDDDSVEVRLQQIEKPASVILFGTPRHGAGHFYMDMLEGTGNHRDVLNLEAYHGGSNYAFADGSARFLSASAYDHRLWLVNPDFEVP